MNGNRRLVGWMTLLALLALVAPALGQGGESAGMITELRVNKGRVEVKGAGAADWRRAGPLLALRAGDSIRATNDALAVILLSGGRGSAKVTAASSPYVVPGRQGGDSKAQKLVELSLGFLSTTGKEEPRATLSTRGGPRPPVILSPRNSTVLPESLTFEWLGSRFSRYTVRVVGPKGVVLEKKELMGARFDYPAGGPPLEPGVRYTFQVIAGNRPAQQAWFEVVDPARAQTIRQELKELEQGAGPMASANTLVALRAGFLASNGLIHDARLTLVAALTKDPDEPTFHLLLGKLYERAGLRDQAAEAYDEASYLLTGPTKQ